MEVELHPQARVVLQGLLNVPNRLATPDLAALRGGKPGMNALVGVGEDVFRSWNSSIPLNGGVIPARWYVPTTAAPEQLTVFVHGGGWVSGTLDDYDALCRSLALRSGGAVVSLDYSLSPEARFPIAIEQVRGAILNAAALARREGLDIGHVAVAGDSAGGNLVAGALHTMAADNQPMPEKAVFIYPATDTSMDSESWRQIGSDYNLDETKMVWFWEQYLGPGWQTKADLARSPQSTPLLSEHLHRFPESLVVTATHDPLKDEGKAFHARLKAAGIASHHIEVPGQIHGFLRFRGAMTDPVWGADAVMQKIGTFLKS